MTLIELLIVIVILTTLVAAAIPLLAPATDARRIREAARGLNTYITVAQSRAIRTGRPAGIALKKLSADTNNPDDNGVCLEVFQVEQPAPFAGFDENSMVRIALDPRNNPNDDAYYDDGGLRIQFVRRQSPDPDLNDTLPPGLERDLIPDGVFRRGDVIEIGGKRYEFSDTEEEGELDSSGFYISTSGEPNGELFVRALDIKKGGITLAEIGQGLHFTHFTDDNGVGQRLPPNLLQPPNPRPPYWTEPMPYKILRQPMLTSTEPYQLPEGTAIDLRGSGDYEMFFHKPDGNPSQNQRVDNSEAVVIMFTPEGSVERVRMSLLPRQLNGNTFVDSPTTYNLFLLVGLRANVPVEDYDFSEPFATQEALEEKKAQYNWLNLDSRWVMIGPQSGNVVTVENAFVRPEEVALLTSNYPTLPDKRDEEIRRAREFAREMTRTGGR